jgi:hypothetical protein
MLRTELAEELKIANYAAWLNSKGERESIVITASGFYIASCERRKLIVAG